MAAQSTAVRTVLRVRAGGRSFRAVLERQAAPQTCAAFEALLPFSSRLVHARWCGEAAWLPLGHFDFGVGYENATGYPAPGQVLLYPGGLSETEILIPYGATHFASKVGPLAGNHFLTILEDLQGLGALGQHVLWHGAQDIVFERIEP